MRYTYFIAIIACLILAKCGPNVHEKEVLRIADSTRKADSLSKIATLAKEIELNDKTPSDKKFIKTVELKFKVNNVLYATEKIEDYVANFNGFITYSNLNNRIENKSSSRISRDSILIVKQIVVENEIRLRIPNERLDSFVRKLNQLIVFLDFRTVKLDDITLQLTANQKISEKLQKYEQRQKQHIENRESKLKEYTTAEEKLLIRQNEADEIKLKTSLLEEQLKYCNVTIYIYQKPLLIKETISNFEYISESKPHFITRIWDSVIQGWLIFVEALVVIIRLWGVVVLGIGVFLGVKYLSKLYKRIKW